MQISGVTFVLVMSKITACLTAAGKWLQMDMMPGILGTTAQCAIIVIVVSTWFGPIFATTYLVMQCKHPWTSRDNNHENHHNFIISQHIIGDYWPFHQGFPAMIICRAMGMRCLWIAIILHPFGTCGWYQYLWSHCSIHAAGNTDNDDNDSYQ